MFDPKKIFDLLRNPGDLQKNVAEKLKQYRATGEAAGGMVKVTMNGQFEVEDVKFEEHLLKEDRNFIEEVTKAAINDASSKVRSNMSEYLRGLAGNIGL